MAAVCAITNDDIRGCVYSSEEERFMRALPCEFTDERRDGKRLHACSSQKSDRYVVESLPKISRYIFRPVVFFSRLHPHLP